MRLFLSDPDWWSAVSNTLIFTVVSVALESVLGLGIAMVANSKFKGRTLLRVAILVPWAIPHGGVGTGLEVDGERHLWRGEHHPHRFAYPTGQNRLAGDSGDRVAGYYRGRCVEGDPIDGVAPLGRSTVDSQGPLRSRINLWGHQGSPILGHYPPIGNAHLISFPYFSNPRCASSIRHLLRDGGRSREHGDDGGLQSATADLIS